VFQRIDWKLSLLLQPTLPQARNTHSLASFMFKYLSVIPRCTYTLLFFHKARVLNTKTSDGLSFFVGVIVVLVAAHNRVFATHAQYNFCLRLLTPRAK